MTFLAAIGLPIAAALLGATLVGYGQQRSTDSEAGARELLLARGWHYARLIVVIVGCSLMLVEPAVLRPWWLQYGLLLVLPFAIGVIATRVLASRGTETAGEPGRH